jgi:hypothetical protein
MRVDVRLRSPDPDYNVFLADHEIAVSGDDVGPVAYRGRLFVFLHTVLNGSYQPGVHHEAYVFTDAGPTGETA